VLVSGKVLELFLEGSKKVLLLLLSLMLGGILAGSAIIIGGAGKVGRSVVGSNRAGDTDGIIEVTCISVAATDGDTDGTGEKEGGFDATVAEGLSLGVIVLVNRESLSSEPVGDVLVLFDVILSLSLLLVGKKTSVCSFP